MHTAMADGHLSFCKDCVKARIKIYDKQPYVMQRDRERRRGGKDAKHVAKAKERNASTDTTEYKRKWNRENRNKRYAQGVAGRALKSGDLVKPDKCEWCSLKTDKLAKHHPNYTEPLRVIWLCTKCHGKAHWKKDLV